MFSRGLQKHEQIAAWRAVAEADLARLRALSAAQFGVEVLRRGFTGPYDDGERTQIGLSNSLGPEPPRTVGADDIEVVHQYRDLLGPALSALEDAGLLQGEERGRSALRFYRLTAQGRAALEAGHPEAQTGLTLTDLGQEEFVSLTTYRRSGEPVSVPVWIAPAVDDRDILLVTTTARSGKVKRVRHDPRVSLRACDRRGAVPPGAPAVSGVAEIVDGADEVRHLREAIRAKYGERMKITAADQGSVDPAEPARVILRIRGSQTEN